jgi:hypothetical protein
MLDNEEIRVKFKKDVIVKSDSMNRGKIVGSLRNMKDMIKFKIMMRSTNNSMTNMSNMHTWPTCNVNLISSVVGVFHSQFIQFTSDMIHCTRVSILVGVNTKDDVVFALFSSPM